MLFSRGADVAHMSVAIRVRDVMSSPVRTTAPDTAAADAAGTCTAEAIGSLAVVDDGELVGIVTSDDFVRLLAESADPATRPVSAFMSAPVETIDPEASVSEAVAAMVDAGVARLVVVEDGAPVGLVSTDDVIRYVPQVFHRQQVAAPVPEEHRYSVRQETAYEQEDWGFECVCRDDAAVSVGDRVTFTKPISEGDVRSFAAASGDTNRLHLDDEFAAGTRFGRRIVHGTLVSGLISAALARLPGLTIYISQDLSFLAPVDIGDRVSAVCTVVDSLDGDRYALTTDVLGDDGEPVVEGEATVLIDDAPEVGHREVEAVA